MICSKCGSNEPDYALYCTKCGAKLEGEAPAIPYDTSAPDTASPFAADASSPYAGQGAGSYTAPASDTPYTGYTAPAGDTPYSGYRAPASGGAGDDWKATVALVCGIASLPCCFTCWGGALLGVAAIVFGILGLKSNKSSFAIAGIVCGAVGALLSLLMLIAAFGFSALYDASNGFEEIIENVPGTFNF